MGLVQELCVLLDEVDGLEMAGEQVLGDPPDSRSAVEGATFARRLGIGIGGLRMFDGSVQRVVYGFVKVLTFMQSLRN